MFRQDVVRFGGAVQMAQRRRKGRQPFARHPGFILPFRQIGQMFKRAIYCAPDISEREAFRQRVNRLDQRQRGKAGFIHDAVGMNHLQHAVVEFGSAGDIPSSPSGSSFSR